MLKNLSVIITANSIDRSKTLENLERAVKYVEKHLNDKGIKIISQDKIPVQFAYRTAYSYGVTLVLDSDVNVPTMINITDSWSYRGHPHFHITVGVAGDSNYYTPHAQYLAYDELRSIHPVHSQLFANLNMKATCATADPRLKANG